MNQILARREIEATDRCGANKPREIISPFLPAHRIRTEPHLPSRSGEHFDLLTIHAPRSLRELRV